MADQKAERKEGGRGGTDRTRKEIDTEMDTEPDQTGGEDTVANLIIGVTANAPLASSPGLELHHPIMSMHGEHGGRLDRERQ